MPDGLRAALSEALRELVEELRERAERAGPDPLRSVEFRLEEDTTATDGVSVAWTLVIVHASGHAEGSAHLLEDRIRIRPLEDGDVELVFASLFGDSEHRRIACKDDEPTLVLDPIEAYAASFLPQAPED